MTTRLIDDTPVSDEAEAAARAQRFAAAPARLSANVKKELFRRLGLGVPVDLGGGLSFVVQIDEDSQGRITGLAVAATRAQMLSVPFSTPFRDIDNINHTLDAAQMISLAEQALGRVTAIREASWALKDTADPSVDITDDSHWPA